MENASENISVNTTSNYADVMSKGLESSLELLTFMHTAFNRHPKENKLTYWEHLGRAFCTRSFANVFYRHR